MRNFLREMYEIAMGLLVVTVVSAVITIPFWVPGLFGGNNW